MTLLLAANATWRMSLRQVFAQRERLPLCLQSADDDGVEYLLYLVVGKQ